MNSVAAKVLHSIIGMITKLRQHCNGKLQDVDHGLGSYADWFCRLGYQSYRGMYCLHHPDDGQHSVTT